MARDTQLRSQTYHLCYNQCMSHDHGNMHSIQKENNVKNLKKKKINTFFFTFISFKEFFYLKKFANKVKMWANSDALLDNAKS